MRKAFEVISHDVLWLIDTCVLDDTDLVRVIGCTGKYPEGTMAAFQYLTRDLD